MAYLVRRGPDRTEIRESISTARGPRSRRLVGFRGALTQDVLERAAAEARRPFDPRALVRRARAAGIEVVERSREPEARALLARLRRRDPLDSRLAALLRSALDGLPREPIPEELEDVADWVGASAADRGNALRQLLDLYGRIAASRPPPRQREKPRFPHIESRLAS
jgi:hypothetical protein